MRKAILKIMAIATFALLMVFNVTTTMNSSDFSLGGLKVLAFGTSGGGCPTCPSEDELDMDVYWCDSGEMGQKCVIDWGSCSISGQDPCD